MAFKIFIIWVFLLIGRPQDFLPFLAPFRLSLLFTALTLGVTVFERYRFSIERLLSSIESKKYLILYFIMLFGVPFAYHRRQALMYLLTLYLPNILFFVIFILHVDSFRRLKQVLFTLVLAVFCYGVGSLVQGESMYGRFMFGTMYDPNDLAHFFVSLFPIAFFFVRQGNPFYKKVIAIIALIVSPGIIILSGSRGGFLGMGIAFMLFTFTKFGSLKKSYKVAAIIGLVAVFMVYAGAETIERYKSLTNLEEDYNITGSEGRLHIWGQSVHLIISNPITGVGVDCFSMALGMYRASIGDPPKWKAAHNSYIQLVTEVGLIGFAVFMSLIFTTFKNFFQLARIETDDESIEDLRTISGFLLIGFVGHLSCATFLSQAYGSMFTLYFALSATIRLLVEQIVETGVVEAET